MSKSNILPFNYNGHQLSTITDGNGDIWFVAKEVADILEYSDAYEMTKRLDDDEKLNRRIAGTGQRRDTTLINESGLYSSILNCTKPEAKPFKKWVTGEVLPMIRKTGSYTAAKITPADKAKFDMSLKLARVAMVELNMAPSGRLMLLKQVETNFDLPATLPNYADDNNGSANGSMEATSLTELLREFDSGISAKKANDVLLCMGFLKEASRPSTKTPDKVRYFKVIDGDGLKFGKNMTSTSNPRETQPLWYRDTFSELLALVVDNSKSAA